VAIGNKHKNTDITPSPNGIDRNDMLAARVKSKRDHETLIITDLEWKAAI
jgi:hypothetical protein